MFIVAEERMPRMPSLLLMEHMWPTRMVMVLLLLGCIDATERNRTQPHATRPGFICDDLPAEGIKVSWGRDMATGRGFKPSNLWGIITNNRECNGKWSYARYRYRVSHLSGTCWMCWICWSFSQLYAKASDVYYTLIFAFIFVAFLPDCQIANHFK